MKIDVATGQAHLREHEICCDGLKTEMPVELLAKRLPMWLDDTAWKVAEIAMYSGYERGLSYQYFNERLDTLCGLAIDLALYEMGMLGPSDESPTA